MSLSDYKIALVTGASSGVGVACVEALRRVGVEVVALARREERLKKLAKKTGCETLVMDLTNTVAIYEQLGSRQFDILINNAGNVQNSAPFEQRALEDWNYTFAANSTGTFLCAKEAAKHMMARETGTIINIASISGMIGKERSVYEGTEMVGVTIDYSAAKGAVINMTRDMACYLGPHGIRVNSISTSGFERGHLSREELTHRSKLHRHPNHHYPPLLL